MIDPSKPESIPFPYKRCFFILCRTCEFKETCKACPDDIHIDKVCSLPVVEEGAGISSDAMAILCGLGVFIAGVLVGSFLL